MRGSEPFVDGLSFTDVQSVFRELEEVESVLGDAEDIVEDSWGAFHLRRSSTAKPQRWGLARSQGHRRSSMLANRSFVNKAIHERWPVRLS